MSAPRTFDIDRPDIADVALPMTGERQVSSTLEGVAPDHRNRYIWAAEYLETLQNVKGEPIDVLDAGCGCGYGAAVLAAKGFNVTARDIDAKAIRFAEVVWKAPNISYEVGNIEAPGITRAFDAIVCFECLEHVEATVALAWFPSMAPVLLASVPNEEVMPFTPKTHPFHRRHYTPAEFEHILGEYDITVRRTQQTKRPGEMEDGFDGRTLIVAARVK